MDAIKVLLGLVAVPHGAAWYRSPIKTFDTYCQGTYGRGQASEVARHR